MSQPARVQVWVQLWDNCSCLALEVTLVVRCVEARQRFVLLMLCYWCTLALGCLNSHCICWLVADFQPSSWSYKTQKQKQRKKTKKNVEPHNALYLAFLAAVVESLALLRWGDSPFGISLQTGYGGYRNMVHSKYKKMAYSEYRKAGRCGLHWGTYVQALQAAGKRWICIGSGTKSGTHLNRTERNGHGLMLNAITSNRKPFPFVSIELATGSLVQCAVGQQQDRTR